MWARASRLRLWSGARPRPRNENPPRRSVIGNGRADRDRTAGGTARRYYREMEFQWLHMRIGEERDRRQREAAILARLPVALEDLHRQLTGCAEAYDTAFGPEEAVEITLHSGRIRVAARERKSGKWEATAKVEITILPSLPGFKVERGTDEPLLIEIGVLPGDKLCYRNADKYLTEEEMTRRILDRVLFPKLGE